MYFKEFVLSLIGAASALRQNLVIPIVLRSLAGSIPFLNNNPAFIANPDFLATLDTGEHHSVKSYELSWWSGRKRRNLNTVEILNASTLEKCLTHFRDQKSNPITSIHLPAGANAGIHARDRLESSSGTGAGFAESSSSAGAGCVNPSPPLLDSPPVGAGVSCRKCFRYRQLLSDVLQEIIKYQSFASGMATSSENLLNLGIRKASTFNLLHEAAIMKESADLAPPAQLSERQNIIKVHQNATLELNRLKDLPASSYKWTWGESLTEDDVLDLRRTGIRPGPLPHSGYDISLAEGRLGGQESPNPSKDFSSMEREDPADENVIPPTAHLFPKYFSQIDHRHVYDPFRLSVPDSPNTALGSSTGVDIVQKKIPESTEDDILDLVENWNDDENSDESPAAHISPVSKFHPAAHNSPAPEASPALEASPAPHSSPAHFSTATNTYLAPQATPAHSSPAPQSHPAPALGLPPLAPVIPAPGLETVDPDPLDITALWFQDEIDQEHSGDELILPSYSPVSGGMSGVTSAEAFQVLAEWNDSEQGAASDAEDNPLTLVEQWDESENNITPPVQAEDDPLNLVEQWDDSETNVTHSERADDDPLNLIEQWDGSDIPVNDVTPPERAQLDWSYGPEHFSFLNDEMFEYDDDE